MRLGTFYFYRKYKKVKIEELISEKKQFDEVGFDPDILPFKIPTTTDDVLDMYNSRKIEKHLKLTDMCYLVVDLDKGEKHIKEETDKIRKSKGFIRFLDSNDIEREKNYKEND